MKTNQIRKKTLNFLMVMFVSSLLLSSCSEDDTIPLEEEQEEILVDPEANFTLPTDIFAGEEINFTDLSVDSDGSIESYDWDFGDGNSSTEANPTHIYATEGNYNVSLSVTDNDGLTDTETRAITVQAVTGTTGLFDQTINHEGNTRAYSIYIPTSYTGDSSVPLVFYFHGAPEDRTIAQGTTNYTAIAEANGFIMVYPEAFFEDNNGFVWADGRNGVADQAGINDVGFVNELINTISNEYNINADKIYASGFSNGGFLVQHLAQQTSTPFSAFASTAASLHLSYANNSTEAKPMLYMYGTADPFLSYDNGGTTPGNYQFEDALDIESAVDYWVANNNCNTTPTETNLTDSNSTDNSTVTTFEYSGEDDGAIVKFYRINGGGHTWPGVDVRQAFFGSTNLDIDASEEIWNFFNQF